MRVLFVTFHYPPFNAVAGLRASKLTKYLVDQGVEVSVLTADRDDLPADLPVEIPSDLVVRTPFVDVNALPKALIGRNRVSRRGFEFGGVGSGMRILGLVYRNLINFPDGQIGWYPAAVDAGKQLIERWRPDVIVSVASPWTSHLVGRSLARRYAIPWVAEYQDPWTDALDRRRVWPLSALERVLEGRVTSDARGIVAVSDAWADDMRRRFPRARVEVVPCGFDPAEYADLGPPPELPLRLTYTGRLYERQDPFPLFEAVRLLIERKTLSSRDVRVEFFGRYLDQAREALRRSGLDASVVSIADAIPHAEAVRIQQRSHALLLFMTNDDDVGRRPAKLYEYLGSQRPILVIGGTPSHEATRLVAQYGAGVHATSTEEIARQIERWWCELREGGAVATAADRPNIDGLSWPSLARQMRVFLEDVRREFPA